LWFAAAGDRSAMEQPTEPDRGRRSRENEERFARANGEIERKAVELGIHRIPFLCECSDLRCTEVIQLTLADYRAAKGQENVFLLLPGHVDASIEHVVQNGHGFVLVRKDDLEEPPVG
jgi:hypothetical protein